MDSNRAWKSLIPGNKISVWKSNICLTKNFEIVITMSDGNFSVFVLCTWIKWESRRNLTELNYFYVLHIFLFIYKSMHFKFEHFRNKNGHYSWIASNSIRHACDFACLAKSHLSIKNRSKLQFFQLLFVRCNVVLSKKSDLDNL